MATLITISSKEASSIVEIVNAISIQEKEVFILFIGEGCKLLEDKKNIQIFSFAKLFILEDECNKKFEKINVIDYDGWVKLIELCSNIVNWC
ncbi:hypothetical protein JW865_01805 [Candidatus Bathyarchaeota archaeon]|nr:hypothetical protein [Candidatus Bathyarchaeota archaeon]